MAKNITLLGANYPDVPAVTLPQTGGGNALFVDDDEISDVEEAFAIVIDGNTAPKNITSGKYLFIKNHSTLSTGGYHATTDINSGDSISSSNVEKDPDGICNTLGANLNDYIKIVEASIGFTGVISGKGVVLLEGINVSSYIPTGYKMIGAYGLYPGDEQFCFVQVATSVPNITVSARICNYTDTPDSGTASVMLICIRS